MPNTFALILLINIGNKARVVPGAIGQVSNYGVQIKEVMTFLEIEKYHKKNLFSPLPSFIFIFIFFFASTPTLGL